MPLHDPVPPEPEPPASGNGPPAPADRVHPTPLSPTGMAFLHQSLARQQRRRRGYQAGPLRVSWDGAVRGQMDRTVGVGEPFRVPLRASYVEIVGDDAEGALLLAVVPLPDPDEMEDDGVEHLAVTLEGGQTVTVAIALDYGSGGKARAYVIQITYAESASATGVSVREPASPFVRTERDMVDYLDNGVVGCHWVAGDGIILWANRADYETLGYTQEEYVGHHIAEFHADPDVSDDMLRRLAQGETLYNYRARLRHKNGSVQHVLIASSVLFDDEGHFLHTRCYTVWAPGTV
jgi:PAS domain S-box-containing protein